MATRGDKSGKLRKVTTYLLAIKRTSLTSRKGKAFSESKRRGEGGLALMRASEFYFEGIGFLIWGRFRRQGKFEDR